MGRAFDGLMNTLGGIGVFGLFVITFTPGLLAALVLVVVPLLVVALALALLAAPVVLAIRHRPARARSQAGMRRRAAPRASRTAPVASS